MATAEVDLFQFNQFVESFAQYTGLLGPIVNDCLSTEGYDKISQAITRILPVSGRTFAGHNRGAKASGAARVFQGKPGTLNITVVTRRPFYYLYFPDSGSNTIHHCGDQQFMIRGAESVAPEIVDAICSRMVKTFEEG